MRLRHCSVDGYRALKAFPVAVHDFNVLIGENNSGKSSLLQALELFLSSSVRGLQVEHFNALESSRPFSITCRFEDLSAEEKEKLGPWTVDGALTVRKTYSLDEKGKAAVSYLAIMRQPKDDWLRDDFASYADRSVLAGLPINAHIPTSGRITKAIYSDAIGQYLAANGEAVVYESVERENPAGFKQVLDGYLPDFHFVPAVRDASDEAKVDSRTLFGKILAVVIERVATTNPKFKAFTDAAVALSKAIEGERPEDKLKEIQELEGALEKELGAWGVDVTIGVTPPDVDQVLKLGTRMMVDDGIRTGVESKGHGLQRALIFALMRVWAQTSQTGTQGGGGPPRKRAIILAFEEPELFLHPQLARSTYDALKKIANTDQVVVCTHSPNLIRMEDYRHLVIVRKGNHAVGAKPFQVTEDIFTDVEEKRNFDMIRFFNPERNELFFAGRVVLVEGPVEKCALPVVATRLGIHRHEVTLVNCEGKYNLRLYMRVLNRFRIPYLVMHDEDPIPLELLPKPGEQASDEYKAAKSVFDENARIAADLDATIGTLQVVTPDFEALVGRAKPHSAVTLLSDTAIPIVPKVEEIARTVYVESPAS